MFDDGYTDEIARRDVRPGGMKERSVLDWVALALAAPAAWMFWVYVAQPVWQFTEEISTAAQVDRARMEELKPMLGRCYTSAIGSVGAVIRIENGTEVKMAFKGGVTGFYPVSALKTAECPKD